MSTTLEPSSMATSAPNFAALPDRTDTGHGGDHLSNNAIIDALRLRLGEGQVLSKLFERTMRAGDASIYRLVPRVVVLPRNLDDLLSVLEYCRAVGLHLTFRAAGTSLSGQAVTDGVLVDIGHPGYWRGMRILDGGKKVAVEPGVIAAHVNAFLAPYKAKIGPDPASINAAMMGGVAANNASGMCCGVQFNSYHTMASMVFVLPDGLVVDTADPNADDQLRYLRPRIHEGLGQIRDVIRNHPELVERIRRKFSIKNTCGYSMNAFVDFDRPVDILAHLLIGSEGTLGFISEITLNTLPDKPLKATALVYFEDLVDAGRAIFPLAKAGADVLEIMDRNSMISVEEEMGYPFVFSAAQSGEKQLPVIEGNCAALLVEFQDESEEALLASLEKAGAILAGFPLLAPVEFTRDPAMQAHYWHMRKGLFPSVGAMREMGTAVLIEDIAVDPRHLADLCADLQGMFVKYQFPEAIIFGHAKDGNLHFVICTDFSRPDQVARYASLMDELTRVVVEKYDGSLKAEHGTGRNIAPFVELEWGNELYELMWDVKRLLDPQNILNPGVILNRDPKAHLRDLKVMPTVDPIVDKCIECGFCEPRCPSRDITTTPRQRIAVLREVNRLRGIGDRKAKEQIEELLRDYQYYGNETCATDGMCATSCPVKINTGEMIKDLRHEQHGALSRTIAMAIARNFGLAARGARLGLALVNAGGEMTRQAARLGSAVLHTFTGGATPQLNPRVPIPKAAPSLPRKGSAGAAARRAVAVGAEPAGVSGDGLSNKVAHPRPASEDPKARFAPGDNAADLSLEPGQSEGAATADITLSGSTPPAPGVGAAVKGGAAGALREVIYFPTCLTRSLGNVPGEQTRVGLAEAIIAILEETGHAVRIPENIPKLCCGQPFFSKGYYEAGIESARQTVSALWELSRAGEVPIICDTSPCSGQFAQCGKYLQGQDLERWKALKIYDFPIYLAREVLPSRTAEVWPKLDRHVVLHPTCTLMKLGGLPDLKLIASTFATKATVPVNAECCGFAGDRGFLVPELTLSATAPESEEACSRSGAAALEGMETRYYSTCRTCEMGMTAGTGEIYSSIAHLVYDALVAPKYPELEGVWRK